MKKFLSVFLVSLVFVGMFAAHERGIAGFGVFFGVFFAGAASLTLWKMEDEQ